MTNEQRIRGTDRGVDSAVAALALVEAGADFVAVSAGVWEHPDGPQDAVRQFNALFSA